MITTATIDRIATEAGLLADVLACEAREYPEILGQHLLGHGRVSHETAWTVAAAFDARWQRPVTKSLRHMPTPWGHGIDDFWQDLLIDLATSWSAGGWHQQRDWFAHLRRRMVWLIRGVFQKSARRRLTHCDWPTGSVTGEPWEPEGPTALPDAAPVIHPSQQWTVVQETRPKLTARERVVFDFFCDLAQSGGAKDRDIANNVYAMLGIPMSPAAVNKMMQRIRAKLWAAMTEAGVAHGPLPAIGSGARHRCA